jgi:hypothetical protein
MNERDKELAKQAWTENDWDGHVDIPKLIQLVRADEREKCSRTRAGKPRILPSVGMGALWEEQAHCFAKGWHEGAASVRKAIRARGNI